MVQQQVQSHKFNAQCQLAICNCASKMNDDAKITQMTSSDFSPMMLQYFNQFSSNKYKLKYIGMQQTTNIIGQESCQIQPLWKVNHKEACSLLRTIGAFISQHKPTVIKATGILLSKNIVLVSASSLYDMHQIYQYDKFNFYLPANGIGREYYEVKRYMFPSQYIQVDPDNKLNKLEFDYGIVQLKGSVDCDQFPKICASCDKCLIQNNMETYLHMYGYPLIYDNYSPINKYQTQFILEQYAIKKLNSIAFAQLAKYRIEYTIDTYLGLTGSPVMVDNHIIAIHTDSNDKKKKVSVGRLFDQVFICRISKMFREMNGKQLDIGLAKQCIHKKSQQQLYRVKIQTSKIIIGQYKDRSFSIPLLQEKWQQINKGIHNKEFQAISILNLQCGKQQKFKLTSVDMRTLSQINMPCLTQLNLENNIIGDEGLEFLGNNKYSSLKTIFLDNNDITINGIKFLLFNTWDQKVNHNLFSVQTNGDYGYHLHVGQSIPLMKRLVKAKYMSEIDQISSQTNKNLSAMNLLLQTPLENQDWKKQAEISRQIEKKHRQISAKNIYSLSSVFVQFKQMLGDSINFMQGQNIKSKITSKILFSGLLDQRLSFEIKMQSFQKLHFSDFRHNYKKLRFFQDQYLSYIHKEFNIQATDMNIDKVIQGSIRAKLSGNINLIHPDLFQKVVSYFQGLMLTEDSFDSRGNFKFPEVQNASIQCRGGLPYYQPVLGRRFGINILNLYENDNWLKMDGNKDQWAVGFHGTLNTRLKEIVDGRGTKMLETDGPGQSKKESICLKSSQKVEKGAYLSPYFLTSLFGYAPSASNFHLVLQCRAEPKKIKIASDIPHYWVINEPKDVRAYGIILFTKQEGQKLKHQSAVEVHKKIYKQQFNQITWESIYKKKYWKFIGQPQPAKKPQSCSII